MNKLNYTGISDEKLVKMVHDGDEDAQEYIINKYKNLVKVKARTYFIVGGDKEDIIQEGMIGLFKSIRDYKFDKKVSFYSFAELCITRQIITAIKTATRQKHIPLNSYISLNKQIFENNKECSFMDSLIDNSLSNPEELMIVQENKSRIETYINHSLSSMEYKVLSLYLNGNSYNEIGKIMSKDEKSIDNALQRVRKKIVKVIDSN